MFVHSFIMLVAVSASVLSHDPDHHALEDCSLGTPCDQQLLQLRNKFNKDESSIAVAYFDQTMLSSDKYKCGYGLDKDRMMNTIGFYALCREVLGQCSYPYDCFEEYTKCKDIEEGQRKNYIKNRVVEVSINCQWID